MGLDMFKKPTLTGFAALVALSSPAFSAPRAKQPLTEAPKVHVGRLLHNSEANKARTGVIQHDQSKTFRGYTLFTPRSNTGTFLIDMDGKVVHKWDLPEGMAILKQAKLLENGNLLRMIKPAGRGSLASAEAKGGSGGTLQEVDWEGNIVWEYYSNARNRRAKNDFIRLANGNTLFLAYDQRTAKEALEKGMTEKRLGGVEMVYPMKVVEVNPQKKIVWEWRFWDHYSSAKNGNVNDPGKVDLNIVGTDNPEQNQDMTHSSIMNYDPVSDKILLTSRHTSEIYVIDHSTVNYKDPAAGIAKAAGPAGDILARYGNPANYKAGKPSSATSYGDRKFYCQHGPNWVGERLPGAGHILVLNNGVGRPGGDYGSIHEIDPKTGKDVWVWTVEDPASFAPQHNGSAQRLPNGNTLSVNGPAAVIFEITSSGEVVWEYKIAGPAGGGTRRGGQAGPRAGQQRAGGPGGGRRRGGGDRIENAIRYAPDYPGLKGRIGISASRQ